MHIVIAPDSFKECLSAQKVAEAIASGWKKAQPDATFTLVPMADGGEGTLEALMDATHGTTHTVTVTGPMGTPVDAQFGFLGNSTTAVVEMAQASGIELVAREIRNPLVATTFGTGELIKAALDAGATQVITCLGGSATNDGGAGMMAALGVKFLDENGHDIGYTIENFGQLSRIDLSNIDTRLKTCTFTTACDVDNPLCGERGASAVFGPQKAATPEMVQQLDGLLSHYATVLENSLGKTFRDQPGCGAAGGTAAALIAFMDATLKPGIEIVVEATELRRHLQTADLVITGEGRIDAQSLGGKTPVGVARHAKSFKKPVIAFGGSVTDELDALRSAGIDVALSVMCGPSSLAEALAEGERNLIQTAQTAAAIYLLQR